MFGQGLLTGYCLRVRDTLASGALNRVRVQDTSARGLI